MVRGILITLGCLAVVAWIYGYFWLSGMACAFSGPEGSKTCKVAWPWALRGEDLLLMVIVPGGVVFLLFLVAWILGRRRSEQ